MKKLSVLILILVSFNSCNDAKETESNISKIKIDFLKSYVFLPKEYNKISFEDFEKKILEVDSTNALRLNTNLNELKYNKGKILIFVDSNDVRNSVFLMSSGDYLPINKNTASLYGSLIAQHLESKGTNHKILQNKVSSNTVIKYIKIKTVFIDENNNNFYLTQYLISGNLTTFSMIVHSQNDNDFEELIKMIKM